MNDLIESARRPDMDMVAEIAQKAASEVIASFRRPSFRAGFGAALLSTVVFARAGARPGIAIFSALMIGASVEKLYGMAEDMHRAAVLQLGKADEAGEV